MYSHIFNFSFAEANTQAKRMRFLADLFEEVDANGSRASDVYWCTVSYLGAVEFYSNTLETTKLVEQRLIEAEIHGHITQSKPGLKSVLTFFSRMSGGLIFASFNFLRHRGKGKHH